MALLDRLQEQIAERKDRQIDKKGQRDASDPKRKAPAVKSHRPDDDSPCEDDLGIWPQQRTDQFRGNE